MEEKTTKNSRAKIIANNKYKTKTYKRIVMDLRPEVISEIKETAAEEGVSITSYLVGLHKKHIEEKKRQN